MMNRITSLIFLMIAVSLFAQESVPDDARWSDQFFLGGFDGVVRAIEVAPNGNIFVGGMFNLINGLKVSGIAMWDGEKWNALQGGVSDGWNTTVYSIVFDGENVYVGGDFTRAGDIEANRIAMWDGTEWHALSTGVDNTVYTIAVDNGNVYIGGSFIKNAGPVAVSNVAKWDGQNWSAMGTGVTDNNYVNSMIARNDTVYVGGNFKLAGVDTVNYITFWDGAKWNKMGNGMSGRVNDLAFGDGVIYAIGEFREAGENEAGFIAQWDGQQWSEVGNGLNSSGNALCFNKGNLYAGGRFIMADTLKAARIAKWDGEKWHAFGGGIENPDQILGYRVNAIAIDGQNVYAGGQFYNVEGKEVKYFATWDGISWSGLGIKQDQSVDGVVYAIAIDGNDVYVGGQFVKAGGDTVNNITRWDGQKWHALGDGLNNKVNCMVFHDGKLYAGGTFSSSGDKTVIRIAMWDGEKWNALSEEGINNQVYAMAFKQDTLYIGGNFSSAGSIFARHVAMWYDSEWHALGGDGSLHGAGGLDGYPNSYVTSIVVEGDTVYFGGFFGSALYQTGEGYVNVKSVAKWAGSKWYAAPKFHENIVNQIVYDLCVKDDTIWVAGNFPRYSDWPIIKVVKLNGSEWTDVGDEFQYSGSPSFGNKLHSIIEVNGKIYVAGEPDLVGENATNYVVTWNGSEWISLGSGTDYHIFALATDSNALYVGGEFSMAGGKGSASFGCYDLKAVTNIETRRDVPVNFTLFQNYPNPFNPTTKISYYLNVSGDINISIFDVTGRKVKNVFSGFQNSGMHKIILNGSDLSSGVYFYKLRAGNREQTCKMLLLR